MSGKLLINKNCNLGAINLKKVQMKIIFKTIYLLIVSMLVLSSCKKEDRNNIKTNLQVKATNNSISNERPSQAITYQEMASMFKEYDNGQKLVLDNYIAKKTNKKQTIATISQFFSLSELKQYIAYVEKLSKEKEIDLTGIRIFTSAYPSDYEKEEYRNRISFILAPTTNIGDKNNIAYEPLKSGIKKPVSMQSILNKYADETTKKVNRASVFSLNLTQQAELSSALNRGEINPPPY